MPHPFDRLHTVPAARCCKRQRRPTIDVIEVFNSRIAFPGFNEQAERFAERYRMPAAAGSDAHVLPGLGTALMRHGRVHRARRLRRGPRRAAASSAGPRSLLYLQSLKLLQTSHRAARRGRRAGAIPLHSARITRALPPIAGPRARRFPRAAQNR